MTDLVEKLRATADGDCREVARDLCFEAKDGDEWAELMERAADEIERLRTELEGVYDCLNDWSAFGFDPATNHLHADDGGAPAHCLLYVPKEI